MNTFSWPTYEVEEIKNMRDIKEIFPDGEANHLNWIFCSTAGPHGSNKTLDEIEDILRGRDPKTKAFGNGKYTITVLVVHPRLCVLKFGEISVGLSDIKFLRKLVAETLEVINQSQYGNT